MSPHNYTRFNGSNVNSSNSYHRGQNELGLAMERLLNRVYKGMYRYSGLELFYTRRLFERGITNGALHPAQKTRDQD